MLQVNIHAQVLHLSLQLHDSLPVFAWLYLPSNCSTNYVRWLASVGSVRQVHLVLQRVGVGFGVKPQPYNGPRQTT